MSDGSSSFLGYILSICCLTHVKGLVEEVVLPKPQQYFFKINVIFKGKNNFNIHI